MGDGYVHWPASPDAATTYVPIVNTGDAASRTPILRRDDGPLE